MKNDEATCAAAAVPHKTMGNALLPQWHRRALFWAIGMRVYESDARSFLPCSRICSNVAPGVLASCGMRISITAARFASIER